MTTGASESDASR